MKYPDTKPAPLRLKTLLKRLNVPAAQFARAIGVSKGTLSDILNWGFQPARGWPELQAAIRAELARLGAGTDAIAGAFEPRNTTRQQPKKPSTTTEKETDMLLQKQTLTAAARKHFGLPADPFKNDIVEPSDVFISQDFRFVRETLWQTAKHGGMLAIVGESGSGKTTLLADFKERLLREGRDVVVIEPSVLYMEENDTRGKTMKSAEIVQAILATIAPSVTVRRTKEARDRQMRELLTADHRVGSRHLLLIEEAHCLPTPTLKHLKRFAEIRDGLAPLLSIVLVGQPELRQRLAVNNAEVREVAQRCDVVELPPLDDALAEYLKFKLARVGAELDRVIDASGVDALRDRLTFARRTGNGKGGGLATVYVSLAYPLAVANALTAAMNSAASLGAPVVDAAIVKEA